MDKLNPEINFKKYNYLYKTNKLILVFCFIFQIILNEKILAQTNPAVIPAVPATTVVAPPAAIDEEPVISEGDKDPIQILDAVPNKRRIRRHLSLIKGVKVDEEILIPNIPLKILPVGQTLITIVRIKNSDIFRIEPQNANSGIVTLHNKKTGQIYAELHLDIREPSVDKTIRDIKALLVDIEGLEYKAVNGGVVIDGFVLIPQDLIRLSNVIAAYGKDGPIKITSLVTLSPVARKRIIEYISREVNNPEVTVTSVGEYIKLEGVVNNQDEKTRIGDLVAVYLPAYVTNTDTGGITNVKIQERKLSGDAASFILNLITVRKQEDKEEPPPKMVQVVFHFVEFSERYLKAFSFDFQPVVSTGAALQISATQQAAGQNSVDSIAGLVNNLLPKITWAKTHGFLRVLDTASVLIQDKVTGSINRQINSASGAAGSADSAVATSTTDITVTPDIIQPRAGLVSLKLIVKNTPGGGSISPSTSVNTTISVRDRQSAAFGGIINKSTNNDYGLPTKKDAFLTLTAAKKYSKNGGNFVVFVTPIIKTSASAGVEQVKKKFRLKE